jgi:hypothetical protein
LLERQVFPGGIDVGLRVATAGVVDGRVGGAMTGLDARLGAADSDMRIIAEAIALCGVTTGGISRALVDVETLEDGADAALSPTDAAAMVEMLAGVGGATSEPPERNAWTKCGLAAVKLVRGWAATASITGGSETGLMRSRFTSVGVVDTVGEDCNIGSI